MRALFLIPGNALNQIQALPAVAATADQLGFAMQVSCPPEQAAIWKLCGAVEKVIPFSYGAASLADWTNLLGCVREPDFQAVVNLAPSRSMDLMLSMSHIPTRVARSGFSSTDTVNPPAGGWPAQALAAYLKPLGVSLSAADYRLPIAAATLRDASAAQPAGDGPMLLLCPGGGAGDWPTEHWQQLPGRIQGALAGVRCQRLGPATAASAGQRAAGVAAADVVLSSDPISTELALLCGTPVVALGRESASLPERTGVRGLPGTGGSLAEVSQETVLQALGLS